MGALADYLREEMKLRKEGLRPFADRIGVAHMTLSWWLRDVRPEPENVLKIAQGLRQDIEIIRRLAGYPEPPIVEGHAGARGRAAAEAEGRYLPARIRTVEVVGDCLEPEVQQGDVLFIDPELEAQPGDIVTLRDGDEDDTIIRRLVGGRWPKLVCNHEEERYDPERVTGVAVEYRRGLRR